jgi:hypothetical protein
MHKFDAIGSGILDQLWQHAGGNGALLNAAGEAALVPGMLPSISSKLS